MQRSLRNYLTSHPAAAAGMILLTTLLAFGLFIPFLGLYHDDWYTVWSGMARGPGSIFSLFSSDRPFMGWVYSKVYLVLRENVAAWHAVALLARAAGAFAFYWILNLAWPRLKNLSILAAMLFVIFPGFLAQPNAITKINQLTGFAAALFSIAFTLAAVKTAHRGWRAALVAGSMLLAALCLWFYEYMIGLEVMRLVLLAWVLRAGPPESWLRTAKRALLAYLPILLVVLVFLYWRLVIYDSSRVATDLDGLAASYGTQTGDMLLRLVFQTLRDFFSAGLFAWMVQPYLLLAKSGFREIVVAFAVAAAVVVLAVVYHRRAADTDPVGQDEPTPAYPPLAIAATGAFIVLGAVFPVVLSNRFLDLKDPYKAYALHPSAGAIILLLGALLFFRAKYRPAALVTLMALAAFTQSLNAQDWARYWEMQRDYWWQVTWRAPAIKDNTVVMSLAPEGYAFQQDYEVWAPLNLIYHPGKLYSPLLHSEVLNKDTAILVMKGLETEFYERDILMQRDYSNFLLITQPSLDSCVHFIDRNLPIISPKDSLIVEKVGGYSSLDHIEPSGDAPVPTHVLFGDEPEHGWCYFYQRASLARQQGDWARVGALYDEAAANGLSATDASEYFVFVEGLANLNRLEDARAIAETHILTDEPLRYAICNSLENPPRYDPTFGYRLEEIKTLLCAGGAEK